MNNAFTPCIIINIPTINEIVRMCWNKGQSHFRNSSCDSSCRHLTRRPPLHHYTWKTIHEWRKPYMSFFHMCAPNIDRKKQPEWLGGTEDSLFNPNRAVSHSGEAYKYQKHSLPLSHLCLGSHVPASLIPRWRHV